MKYEIFAKIFNEANNKNQVFNILLRRRIWSQKEKQRGELREGQREEQRHW